MLIDEAAIVHGGKRSLVDEKCWYLVFPMKDSSTLARPNEEYLYI